MTTNRQKVGVGTGVLVNKDNKILLIKRQGSHGEGAWAPPGGHVDFGESITECAEREVKEEVALEIKNLKVVGFTQDIFRKEKKHYITIWVDCDLKSGKIKTSDREFSEIGWFSWNNLPKPLFIPLKNFIKGNIFPKRDKTR